MFGGFLVTFVDSWNQKVSAITLGAMEDLGFYTANYEYADKVFYGKDAGCNFLMNPKNNDLENLANCDNVGEFSCSPDRIYQA